MDVEQPGAPDRGTVGPGGEDRATEQPRLELRYAALSDVGRVRKDNQDSGFASENLLVIADGVGGAARGDVASSTAVLVLRRLDEAPNGDLLQALAGAVHRAHDRIAELVEDDPELEGTSTTVTAALFDGHQVGVAHVGDSRGYLLRDGVLSQLTRDHTFVQSLVDEGRITEAESRTHPHRNLILRAVDGVRETDPDLFLVPLAPGDRLLLCSDGASGVLDHDRLADILGTGTVDYAVVELVRAALQAGSSDNVTCVVADVVPDGAPAERDGVPLGAVTGPMLVGAAAEQARRTGTPRTSFAGHRGGDTGELDPVPGASGPDDGGDDADPEELRYAPQEPRRRRWRRTLAVLLVILVVLGIAGVLGYRWTQAQYYVSDHDGSVAIYRGVQADVPGLPLHHLAQQTDVTLAALADPYNGQVEAGIAADSLSEARRIVRRLTGLARICPPPAPAHHATANPSAGTSARPSGSPSAQPSARPSAQPSARPTAQPSARSTSGPGASGTPGATAAPTPTPSASPRLVPPHCIERAS